MAKQARATRIKPTTKNLTMGYLIRAELQRIALFRIETGKAVDWEKWSWCAACVVDAIPPGPYQDRFTRKGKALQGVYYKSWPACNPAAFLCRGKHAIAANIDEVPPAILRAAERACRSAQQRSHRLFLKSETIARLLGVTVEERQALRLRFIGAIDATKDKRSRQARKRKQARDRLNDKTKRRERGARPHSESLAAQARAAGISPDALRQRKHREKEKSEATIMSDAGKKPWLEMGISRRSWYRQKANSANCQGHAGTNSVTKNSHAPKGGLNPHGCHEKLASTEKAECHKETISYDTKSLRGTNSVTKNSRHKIAKLSNLPEFRVSDGVEIRGDAPRTMPPKTLANTVHIRVGSDFLRGGRKSATVTKLTPTEDRYGRPVWAVVTRDGSGGLLDEFRVTRRAGGHNA